MIDVTKLTGITEMAMARAIGMGIYYAPTADAAIHAERMERVVGWAIKRYGAEWAFPRYLALGELAIEQGMKKLYGEEVAAQYIRS